MKQKDISVVTGYSNEKIWMVNRQSLRDLICEMGFL